MALWVSDFWYCVKKTQWLNKIKSQKKVVLGIRNVYDPRYCLLNPDCGWQFACNMDTIPRSTPCYMFCRCKLRFASSFPQFLVNKGYARCCVNLLPNRMVVQFHRHVFANRLFLSWEGTLLPDCFTSVFVLWLLVRCFRPRWCAESIFVTLPGCILSSGEFWRVLSEQNARHHNSSKQMEVSFVLLPVTVVFG